MRFSIILASEILFQGKIKKIYYIICLVELFFYSIFIFLDPISSVEIYCPANQGETLCVNKLVLSSPAGIVIIIMGVTIICLLGVGLIIKSLKSNGLIRRKYLLLASYFIGMIIFVNLWHLLIPKPLLFLTYLKLVFLTTTILGYYGIKEESEEKTRPKKEVRVEGDLFQFSRLERGEITEEEVSISKEKKICLVCKSPVSGFNIFICPECDSMYCGKCTTAIIEIENTCWACNSVIDKTKKAKQVNKQEKNEVLIDQKSK